MAFDNHSKKKRSQSMEMMVEDRISSLSDDALSHILSFLGLREAVKTMVLSKRWEKVWTRIHRIHLDNRQCLAAAITPGLQMFDFLIAVRTLLLPIRPLPLTLFLLDKLVFLRLNCSNVIGLDLPNPKTVRLSSFKILHIARVRFEDESLLKNLLSGCPVLEELYLENVNRKDLYAPKLEYLQLVDGTLLGFSMSPPLPSLVSAVIDIGKCPRGQPILSLSVVELFQGISSVRKLELSTHATKVVEFKVRLHCKACEKAVRKSLLKINGIKCVEIDMISSKITVLGYVNRKAVVKAIHRTGRRAEAWPSVSAPCHREDYFSPRLPKGFRCIIPRCGFQKSEK
ncbi:hypothetical protein PTKIN_Ptkin01aG0308500 [Pterospermum kingtungense]